jgi:hypothetical protein
MAKGTIQFVVQDKEAWTEYAKRKGFKSAGDLARFVLYQYEARYPIKDLVHVRAEGLEGK